MIQGVEVIGCFIVESAGEFIPFCSFSPPSATDLGAERAPIHGKATQSTTNKTSKCPQKTTMSKVLKERATGGRGRRMNGRDQNPR